MKCPRTPILIDRTGAPGARNGNHDAKTAFEQSETVSAPPACAGLQEPQLSVHG